MSNQNEWSYCPTRMKCGVCRETGKLCPHIDTAANQRTEDKLATTPPPKVEIRVLEEGEWRTIE